VLTQIASVREALRQVGRIVLHNHLQNCVTRAVHDGDDAVYDELMAVIDRFNRQG
jgi:DNA-binding FrmR family transcriptional regulator